MTTLDLMFKAWPLVVAMVATIATIAVALYRVRVYGKVIPELEKQIKSRLYTAAGETIYMPRNGCRECRDDCQKVRNREYNEMRNQIGEIVKELKGINKMMGAIMQFMQAQKK